MNTNDPLIALEPSLMPKVVPVLMQMQDMNRKFATVYYGGGGTSGVTETVVVEFDEDDGSRIVRLHTLAEFRKRHDMRGHVIALPNGKTVDLADYWLEYRHARHFDRLVFAPPGSPDRVMAREWGTWRGLAVVPKAGEWTTVETFIRDVICNGDIDHEVWLHNWIAALLQQPGQHGHVAPMLLGGQGVGKGFFVSSVIGGLIRPENFLHLMDPKHVTSDFNGYFENRVLVFADEAFWGSKAASDQLKGKVTEEHLLINKKNLPQEIQRSCIHLIIASNSERPLHVERDDRRYFVLRVSEAHKNDVQYFKALRHELDNGGREAMLDYFMSYTVDWDILRQAPESAAKADLKSASMDAEAEWWQDALSAENWKPTKVRADVMQAYGDWCNAYRRNHFKKTPSALGIWFRRHFELGGYSGWPKAKKVRRDDTTANAWEFPSLAECRKVFDAATGTSTDW